MVIELKPRARRQVLQNKLKFDWTICNIDDYVSISRCFKSSRYNHRHTECRSEETCPLCAEKHKLKEYMASMSDCKCINVVPFNAHNKDRKINENHSSLGRNCPSLQAMIVKTGRIHATNMAQTFSKRKRILQRHKKPARRLQLGACR